MECCRSTIFFLLILSIVACEGEGRHGGGGYDARYDCEQTIACLEERYGDAPSGLVDTCVENSEDLYDKPLHQNLWVNSGSGRFPRV
jgi:hypothetical protein